jgi:F0F1-type ATP synthase assembly protein I
MAPTNEGLGQGVESALVIGLFFGIGWLIDRAAGTTPLFMILLVLLAAVGLFAKFWYGYDARMRQLEAERAERSASARRTGT